MLHRRVEAFKRMLVDNFDEDCESGLYKLNYHLLDNIVEDPLKFETQSVLDSSSYEHSNLHSTLIERRHKGVSTDDRNCEFFVESLQKGSPIWRRENS